MKTVLEFMKLKSENCPISVVTCYDYWSALIINESDIDAVLVGDSTAMVMHGHPTTVNADINMMSFHVRAVSSGLRDKFLIADMPFLAHRKGMKEAMNSVDRLLKAGSHAVKIEGANGTTELIKYIVDSGVPVMGHLGLTPQSVYKLGGFKVQGKNEQDADRLIKDALDLQTAGCFSIVLELVPAKLAVKITRELSIPTIGIGAGPGTSGQVLVLQDLLGMTKAFQPKFLRKYMKGFELIKEALNRYDHDVKNHKFPNGEESY